MHGRLTRQGVARSSVVPVLVVIEQDLSEDAGRRYVRDLERGALLRKAQDEEWSPAAPEQRQLISAGKLLEGRKAPHEVDGFEQDCGRSRAGDLRAPQADRLLLLTVAAVCAGITPALISWSVAVPAVQDVEEDGVRTAHSEVRAEAGRFLG